MNEPTVTPERYELREMVMTINGVGKVVDIRHRSDGTVDYLISMGGGNADVYHADEIEKADNQSHNNEEKSNG